MTVIQIVVLEQVGLISAKTHSSDFSTYLSSVKGLVKNHLL